jgi:hypothetical protein
MLLATRLWHSTGRRMDRMGLQAACEVAGATASTIIGQVSLFFDLQVFKDQKLTTY